MPRLKLQPLPTGQVVVQTTRWVRVFCLALWCYGLVMLHTDLSRPRGSCCTRLYSNHDAAIKFSALWCLLALLIVVSTTQKITLRGGTLRVSWLWGAVRCTRPVERIEVQEVEVQLRGGKTSALRLKLGWLPLYVTPDFDGYQPFRLGLRAVPEHPD